MVTAGELWQKCETAEDYEASMGHGAGRQKRAHGATSCVRCGAQCVRAESAALHCCGARLHTGICSLRSTAASAAMPPCRQDDFM